MLMLVKFFDQGFFFLTVDEFQINEMLLELEWNLGKYSVTQVVSVIRLTLPAVKAIVNLTAELYFTRWMLLAEKPGGVELEVVSIVEAAIGFVISVGPGHEFLESVIRRCRHQ